MAFMPGCCAGAGSSLNGGHLVKFMRIVLRKFDGAHPIWLPCLERLPPSARGAVARIVVGDSHSRVRTYALPGTRAIRLDWPAEEWLPADAEQELLSRRNVRK